MKKVIIGAVAALATAAPLVAAAPAQAASVGGSFSCSNGVTTKMYAPYGYDYHEVNGYYYFWSSPSNYTTTVNWGAKSGNWYLASNVGFNYYVYCR